MDTFIAKTYTKAIALLKHNSMPFGFQAAPVNDDKPEYSYLFGRDGSICALCLLDHDDPALVQSAVDTLISLRNTRSEVGQVPFRADPAGAYRDFWFPGNVDSTLWWVIAALKYVQLNPRQKPEWQQDIEHSLRWLRYQDAAEVGLVMQGQRSDWADELPNHGAVLYSNALWYKAVTEYVATYGPSSLINQAYQEQIYQAFNTVFWPYAIDPDSLPNRAMGRAVEWAKTDLVRQPFYLGYVSRRSYGRRCDIYGNILAMLFGLASPEKQVQIEHYLWSIHASVPYPGKSMYPAIYPGEAEWQEGMAARNQNLPHQYHNGGIWPFIGGFWVTYLALRSQADRRQAASWSAARSVEHELKQLAEANSLNDWEFNEYLHGQYGTAMGMPHQTWNAATFVLAYQAVIHGRSVIQAGNVVKGSAKSVTESTVPLTTLSRKFFRHKRL